MGRPPGARSRSRERRDSALAWRTVATNAIELRSRAIFGCLLMKDRAQAARAASPTPDLWAVMSPTHTGGAVVDAQLARAGSSTAPRETTWNVARHL